MSRSDAANHHDGHAQIFAAAGSQVRKLKWISCLLVNCCFSVTFVNLLWHVNVSINMVCKQR